MVCTEGDGPVALRVVLGLVRLRDGDDSCLEPESDVS